MVAETLRTALVTKGIAFHKSQHPETFTAQEMAAAEHTTGYQVAKPVFVMAGEQLVMAVLPAPYQLDLAKVGKALGRDVRLAREDEFGAVFADCERGAEPPLGTVYGVLTLVDERLTSGTVLFDGGSHSSALSMSREDYLEVVRPRIADIAALE
jgi:Ala-tRNA(Pro) deacylase